MKTITAYRTNDGTIVDNKTEAMALDLCQMINDASTHRGTLISLPATRWIVHNFDAIVAYMSEHND